jgi:hypothetical protein
VPDLGVTLVELLAYVGDQLSYYQDAVATEAYLESARQRISVRRHARLVDYRLHEGCNARAWLFVGVSSDPPPLKASQLAFITAISDEPDTKGRVLSLEQLENVPRSACEWFEPLVARSTAEARAAHGRITFYTWGRRECCLPKGATRDVARPLAVSAVGAFAAVPGFQCQTARHERRRSLEGCARYCGREAVRARLASW